MSDSSHDRDTDPFRPPEIPVPVQCLHCGEEYESYLIHWVEQQIDGRASGFWMCPTPGCDGAGFGFDILPIDPDYHDEHGGWVSFDDDDDEPLATLRIESIAGAGLFVCVPQELKAEFQEYLDELEANCTVDPPQLAHQRQPGTDLVLFRLQDREQLAELLEGFGFDVESDT